MILLRGRINFIAFEGIIQRLKAKITAVASLVIDKLKPRDSDGRKNSIIMQGTYDDMPIIASTSLSSDGYKAAINSYRVKEYITLTGMAKITRTFIRFSTIDRINIGKSPMLRPKASTLCAKCVVYPNLHPMSNVSLRICH